MKNCTGERCIVQYDKVDPATCKAVDYCPQATPPLTKADLIRAMTDEELAEMHVGVGCPPGTDLNEMCIGENGEELLCTPPLCRECWLRWLRQEAHREVSDNDAEREGAGP